VKILVVDDEHIVLDSCQKVLEAEGFQVSLVSSAGEALRATEMERPSLFLIDVKMPERDGMYLMAALGEKWPDIPIISMSGYETRSTIEGTYRAGAIRFLSKPFTPDELLAAIHQVTCKGEDSDEEESAGNR